jgi:hypothetical protein
MHRHGAQGSFDGASNSTLENEFGTSEEEAVITQIIEKGTLQEHEVCIIVPDKLAPIVI